MKKFNTTMKKQRNLEAFADAFEARRNSMTCKSLTELSWDGWIKCGSIEVRTRLLRILLPSMSQEFGKARAEELSPVG
jgi:hypothetical protein